MKDPNIQVNKTADLLEHIAGYERDQPQADGTTRACVTLVDVYCATWGACSALKSTFKDILLQDVDDGKVKVRFLQADASAITNELKSSKDVIPPHLQKRCSELRDVHPDFWREKFEGQLGKAKPLFIFFKDCKYIDEIKGVDTPMIKRTLRELIREKQPPKNFISNEDLLRLWSDDIDALNCECDWGTFAKAINIWCHFHPDSPPFNADETEALMGALNISRGQPVHAKALQEWIGDGSFDAKFREACPGYEDRIADERARLQVQKEAEESQKAQKDKEDAAQKEKEAASQKEKEEEEARALKEEEEKRQKEEEARAKEEEDKRREEEAGAKEEEEAGGPKEEGVPEEEAGGPKEEGVPEEEAKKEEEEDDDYDDGAGDESPTASPTEGAPPEEKKEEEAEPAKEEEAAPAEKSEEAAEKPAEETAPESAEKPAEETAAEVPEEAEAEKPAEE